MADESTVSPQAGEANSQRAEAEQAVEFEGEPEPIPPQAITLPPPSRPRQQASPPQQQQQMVEERLTRTATVMRPLNDVLGIPAHSQRPARAEVRRQESKRIEEILDGLLEKPAACDYSLRVDRMYPFKDANGKRLTKLRNILRRQVMGLAELRETLLDLYGGGKYRVTILDEQGDPLSGFNSMQLEFPLDEHPAKDGDDAEETNGNKPPKKENDSPEVAALRDETRRAEQMAELEEKKAEAETRRNNAEARKLMAQRKMEQLVREAMQPSPIAAVGESTKRDDATIKLLEAALKQAEENRRTDRENFTLLLTQQAQQQQAMLAAMAAVMGGKKDDGSLKEMLLAMQANTTQVMTAVVNRPQDNSGAQVMQQGLQQVADSIRQGQEMNFKALEMVQKRDGSEAKNWMQMVQVLASKNDNIGLRDLLAIIGQTRESERETAERYMDLATRFSGGGGDEEETPAGEGFLGAAGRAVLSGFKELVRTAAQRPELLQTVIQLFGSRNPSQQQLVRAAKRLQDLPPAVGSQYQLPIQQQPSQQQGSGLPPAVGMGYANPPQLPMTQPTMTQNQPTMTPQTASAPTGMASSGAVALPSSNAQPSAAPSPQDAVLGELAGVASGFDSGMATPATTAGEQQVQTDSVLDAAAEEQLHDAVSEVVETALVEIRNKPKRRDWPHQADEKWPRLFLQRIAAEPSRDARMALIGSKCDPDLWARMEQVLTAEPEELQLFLSAMDELAAMQNQQPPAAMPTMMQPPPGVVAVQVFSPPQPAVSPPPVAVITPPPTVPPAAPAA